MIRINLLPHREMRRKQQQPGKLGQITTAIGKAGGDIEGIDIVSVGKRCPNTSLPGQQKVCHMHTAKRRWSSSRLPMTTSSGL